MKKIFFLILILLNFSTAYAADTTWNASDKGANVTLSESNMRATSSAANEWCSVRATTSISSGKKYFEIKVSAVGGVRPIIGVSTSAQGVSCSGVVYLGSSATGWGYGGDVAGSQKWNNGSYSGYGATFTTNDIIGVAVDATADKIWVAKNNTWNGDPAAGTSPMFTSVSGTLLITASLYNAGSVTIRAKAASQSYSPPSGFECWDLTLYKISGTLKLKDSDASGSALWWVLTKRSDASVIASGTASATGVYSYGTLPDNTTEYDLIFGDPANVQPPRMIERIKGVLP